MTKGEQQFIAEVEALLLKWRLTTMVPVWDYPELPAEIVSAIEEKYKFACGFTTAIGKLLTLVEIKDGALSVTREVREVDLRQAKGEKYEEALKEVQETFKEEK